METVYYENDGAYFKGRAGLGCVDEVWTPDGWEIYRGDQCKPYAFGNRIELANLPVEAGGRDRRMKCDKTLELPGRRALPRRFRKVGKPGTAFIIPGFPKP